MSFNSLYSPNIQFTLFIIYLLSAQSQHLSRVCEYGRMGGWEQVQPRNRLSRFRNEKRNGCKKWSFDFKCGFDYQYPSTAYIFNSDVGMERHAYFIRWIFPFYLFFWRCDKKRGRGGVGNDPGMRTNTQQLNLEERCWEAVWKRYQKYICKVQRAYDMTDIRERD